MRTARIGGLCFPFLYLALRALLGLFVRSGRGPDVKGIELMVLRVACDFFTVETVLLRRYYVLLFVEHASRRVRLAGCTSNPDGAWVTTERREPRHE